jgi:hypothetical protein
MLKVMEINLERGMPTVDAALQNMKDGFTACRRRGVKVAIVIHGYGSSGVGGGIKAGVKRCLGETGMRSFVQDYVGGEQWHYRKRELLAACRDLAQYEGRIANNEGVTVVVLKNN